MSDLAFSASTWRRLPAPLIAGVLLVSAAVIVALLAPTISPFDPIVHDISNTLKQPSLAHPFGTDNFGRDVLSRVIWGTRVDLQLGLIGVIFPFLIGTTIGLIAG